VSTPTKAGQRCVITGGRMAFNGEGKGPNQGKEVTTVFLHPEQAGTEQENVWHCKAKDGESLQTYYGAGMEADFLECWLEVIEPDESPAATTTSKEVTA
jgi:hypothetical protein